MVVPLLALGGLALSSTGVATWDILRRQSNNKKQELEVEKLKEEATIAEIGVQGKRIELQRQTQLSNVSTEKIASLTPGKFDDVLIQGQKILPYVIIVCAVILALYWGNKKK